MHLNIPGHRHPSIQHYSGLFDYVHLPPHLQQISQECFMVAQTMVDDLQDGPELAAGLRKLLEAKDCFVRQALLDGPPLEHCPFSEPGFVQAERRECTLPHRHEGKHSWDE
jgi:hypothetical protein